MTMADIARYPLVRHLRGTATTHIQHVHAGKTRHASATVTPSDETPADNTSTDKAIIRKH